MRETIRQARLYLLILTLGPFAILGACGENQFKSQVEVIEKCSAEFLADYNLVVERAQGLVQNDRMGKPINQERGTLKQACSELMSRHKVDEECAAKQAGQTVVTSAKALTGICTDVNLVNRRSKIPAKIN